MNLLLLLGALCACAIDVLGRVHHGPPHHHHGGFYRHGSHMFRGHYYGRCALDGIYYKNAYIFVTCSNGNGYEQRCAPGTRNADYGHYHVGRLYYGRDFCGVNLVDEGYGAHRGPHVHSHGPPHLAGGYSHRGGYHDTTHHVTHRGYTGHDSYGHLAGGYAHTTHTSQARVEPYHHNHHRGSSYANPGFNHNLYHNVNGHLHSNRDSYRPHPVERSGYSHGDFHSHTRYDGGYSHGSNSHYSGHPRAVHTVVSHAVHGPYSDGFYSRQYHCGRDGMHYNDESSFRICTNGKFHIQRCAPGTRNAAKSSYSESKTYSHADFCSELVSAEVVSYSAESVESVEKCDEGLTYKDETGYEICADGVTHVQKCGPGTKNAPRGSYRYGEVYEHSDFCTERIIAESSGGECRDGMYYSDANSFDVCSNGRMINQRCGPGTKNGPRGDYRDGTSYTFNDFCTETDERVAPAQSAESYEESSEESSEEEDGGDCTDGFYYYDTDTTFKTCSNGVKFTQECSPGTRNSDEASFVRGKAYEGYMFCTQVVEDEGYYE